MEKFKKGDKVKMSQELKDILNKNGSHEHILEFGDCVGIVGDPYLDWPDNEVYWQPSNLHYLYSDDDLEYVEKEI
jgi:hypothetical protein